VLLGISEYWIWGERTGGDLEKASLSVKIIESFCKYRPYAATSSSLASLKSIAMAIIPDLIDNY
jgi:hypothetical protein